MQKVISFTEGSSGDVTSISNYSYDHSKVQELASHMILAHEYSFPMMDHVVFNKFMKAASPFYKKINRQTAKDDCVTSYELEKKRLKLILKSARKINITTDLWKSGQKIQYMVVTGHFVDNDWILQKRVLNFCNVPPPHIGVIIADALSKCFLDCGIDNKVSCITVDNASYNDVCIRRLKDDFALKKKLSVGGKHFHVRCCAHILNLLLQDGLHQIGDVIDVVRDGIKYLKNSEARLNAFAKIKKTLNLPSRKLILDFPTRWNSTYLMLASAVEVKDVFPRYQDTDPGFHYVPTETQWMKVEEVCKFLAIFYVITNIISGSDYPTSNLFLVELFRIKELLNEKALDHSEDIRFMASSMAHKFDKYWGESNILLSLGGIVDPRYKMLLIKHTFPILYGEDAAPRYIDEIKSILYTLYQEYVDVHVASGDSNKNTLKRKHPTTHSVGRAATKHAGMNVLTGKQILEMALSGADNFLPEKSDLDTYLEEGRYVCDMDANIDVLTWWKGERWRFSILSRMACDILSIPVTTMASESTFSVGGRIIDDRRASMTIGIVEMLLCGNDWIRHLHGLKKKLHEPSDVGSSIDEIMLPEDINE